MRSSCQTTASSEPPGGAAQSSDPLPALCLCVPSSLGDGPRSPHSQKQQSKTWRRIASPTSPHFSPRNGRTSVEGPDSAASRCALRCSAALLSHLLLPAAGVPHIFPRNQSVMALTAGWVSMVSDVSSRSVASAAAATPVPHLEIGLPSCHPPAALRVPKLELSLLMIPVGFQARQGRIFYRAATVHRPLTGSWTLVKT